MWRTAAAVGGTSDLTDLASYMATTRPGPLRLYGQDAPYEDIAREIEGIEVDGWPLPPAPLLMIVRRRDGKREKTKKKGKPGVGTV